MYLLETLSIFYNFHNCHQWDLAQKKKKITNWSLPIYHQMKSLKSIMPVIYNLIKKKSQSLWFLIIHLFPFWKYMYTLDEHKVIWFLSITA